MCKKNNLPALIEEVQKMQATQPKVEGRKEKQTNEEEGSSSSSEDEGDVSILTCKIFKIFFIVTIFVKKQLVT